MKKIVLAVDVDLVVVDTLGPWLNWIKSETGFEFPKHDFIQGGWVSEYNRMTQYMEFKLRGFTKQHSEAAFKFWFQKNLYQNLRPVSGCVNALTNMTRRGEADIVFVSSCVPEHIDSKKKFLRTYMDFEFAFIDTDAKQHVKYDAIIDDTPLMLKKCVANNPNSFHIYFPGVFREEMNMHHIHPRNIIDPVRDYVGGSMDFCWNWDAIPIMIAERFNQT